MERQVRKAGGVRRLEIAEAALRLLGGGGAKAVTTAALAREVGLTTGALFRHFPTLDAVLAEAVDVAVARLEATLPGPAGPPDERLEKLARARVALLHAEPGIAWLLRGEQARQLLPEGALARLQEAAGRTRHAILEALREGAATGGIRSDVAPEVLLEVVVAAVHAAADRVKGHGAASAERTLEGLLRLLRPAPR